MGVGSAYMNIRIAVLRDPREKRKKLARGKLGNIWKISKRYGILA